VRSAQGAGLGEMGCLLAALLTERDPIRGRKFGAELSLRVRALMGDTPAGAEVDRGVVQRVAMAAQQLYGQLQNLDASCAADSLRTQPPPPSSPTPTSQHGGWMVVWHTCFSELTVGFPSLIPSWCALHFRRFGGRARERATGGAASHGLP
jgi:hypothetical protein